MSGNSAAGGNCFITIITGGGGGSGGNLVVNASGGSEGLVGGLAKWTVAFKPGDLEEFVSTAINDRLDAFVELSGQVWSKTAVHNVLGGII